MLNLKDEINRFKNVARLRGIPQHIIDDLSDEVNNEIRLEIYNALESAMQRAYEMGVSLKLNDFLDELTAVRIGDSYRITTDSGRTDFSTPPFPMLPKLLRNPKIAKDGSLYKVIPIKKGNAPTSPSISDVKGIRRDYRVVNKYDKHSPDNDGSFIEKFDTDIGRPVTDQYQKNISSNVEFKTASSKQDASTQWIHPGKNGDMNSALREINDSLNEQVQSIIRDTMQRYERRI